MLATRGGQCRSAAASASASAYSAAISSAAADVVSSGSSCRAASNSNSPPSRSPSVVRTLRISAMATPTDDVPAGILCTVAMAAPSRFPGGRRWTMTTTETPAARRCARAALSTSSLTALPASVDGDDVPSSGGGRDHVDVDANDTGRQRGRRPTRHRRGSSSSGLGGGGGIRRPRRRSSSSPSKPPKEIATLARMEVHVDSVMHMYGERLTPDIGRRGGGDGGDGDGGHQRRRGRGRRGGWRSVSGGSAADEVVPLPPLPSLGSIPTPPTAAPWSPDDTEGLYRELARVLRKLVLGWCAASSRRHRHHPHLVVHSFVRDDDDDDDSGEKGTELTSSSTTEGSLGTSGGDPDDDVGGESWGDESDDDSEEEDGGGDAIVGPSSSPSLPPHVMRAEHWLDVMERLRADRYNSIRRLRAGDGGAATPGVGGMAGHASGGGVLTNLFGGLRGLFGGGDVDPSSPLSSSSSSSPSSLAAVSTRNEDGGMNEERLWAHLTPKYIPTVELYNAVITAYDTTTRPKDAASSQELTRRIEGVLRKMDSAVASGNNPFASPDRDTYHILMRHYGRLRLRVCARKSEALLQRMEVEAMGGRRGGTVVDGGDVVSDAAPAAVDVAPDLETMKLCLSAYAGVRKSAPCALRAEALLEKMERHVAAAEVATGIGGGEDADEADADTCDEAEDNSGPDLSPDTEAYNLCLRAFANSVVPFGGFGPGPTSKDDIARKAEALVERMKRREEEEEAAGRTSDAGPDATTYNLAISILSAGEDGKYVSKALQLLKWMEQENDISDGHESPMFPTTATYNAILSGMKNRLETRSDAFTAEKLIDKMILHADSKPDYTTFDLLFRIWSKAGNHAYCSEAGEKAENLLSRMEIQYAGGNDLVKPDTRMYTHVIRCWACSKKARGIAPRARSVLNRIESQDRLGNPDVKATQAAYTSVIHACSNTSWPEEKAQALQIAFDCYNKIISLGYSPDAVTYSCLLNCVANLLPAEDEARTALAKQVFDAACEQSQVNRAVKYSLRKVSMKLYKNYEEQASHSSRVSRGQAITPGETKKKRWDDIMQDSALDFAAPSTN